MVMGFSSGSSPSLKSLFLWREENQRTRRTNLRSKDENQQQTQPTRDTRSGEQTWATMPTQLTLVISP